MPRPRYPSDDRRSRPHVKVHLTIRHHPTYCDVFQDVDLRGIVLGLWVVAMEHQAARTGNRVTLNRGDIAWVTGRHRPDAALARLRYACGAMAYPMSCHGRTVVVEVRNLQRKQGLAPQLRSGGSATPSASDSEVPIPNTEHSSEPSEGVEESDALMESIPTVGEVGRLEDESIALEALVASIDQSLPGSSVPESGTARHGKWLVELGRLNAIGEPGSKPPGWPWATILQIIAWLPEHERGDFSWGRVVRSPAKLRRHFARILADFEAQQTPKGHHGSPMERNQAEIKERLRADTLNRR